MKKKEAKLFAKYNKNVAVVKEYKPKTKGKVTTGIAGARKDINTAIGNLMLKGSKDELKMVGKVLVGDYFEDWDSETKVVIKY